MLNAAACFKKIWERNNKRLENVLNPPKTAVCNITQVKSLSGDGVNIGYKAEIVVILSAVETEIKPSLITPNQCA